ncbi:hypothetical protein K469DRAFT_25209 [Zopfia rhizophila CBS 207.26]|uniref:Secreted protein n=1 Tax=Zopfia rhizophila CBS 207.26 TaxID=1314779 RepID=A0A6A6EDV2_9PEZI|nr:hypothetical protein K469DRAFT_25209 [Zopfia rhizophila CBS 207.26]
MSMLLLLLQLLNRVGLRIVNHPVQLAGSLFSAKLLTEASTASDPDVLSPYRLSTIGSNMLYQQFPCNMHPDYWQAHVRFILYTVEILRFCGQADT